MQQATAPIGAPLSARDRRQRIARLTGEQPAGHFVPWRGRYVKAPVITVATMSWSIASRTAG
jgi:hypothetical protein